MAEYDAMCRLCAGILPLVDRTGAKIRWKSVITEQAFVARYAPLFAVVLTEQPTTSSSTADEPYDAMNVYLDAVLLVDGHDRTAIAKDSPAALLAHAEYLSTALFRSATVRRSGLRRGDKLDLSWEDWLSFVIDAAILASATTKVDPFYFVLDVRVPFTVQCSRLGVASSKTIVVVQQHNTTSPVEGMVAYLDGNVLARAPWPSNVTDMEIIGAPPSVIACCSDLSIFFVEYKMCNVIASIPIEALVDGPTTLHWSAAQSILYAGGLNGRLWEIDFPVFRAKTATWSPYSILRSTRLAELDSSSVVGISESATPQLLFVLGNKGHLVTYSTHNRQVLSVCSCAASGMSPCTSLVYNLKSDLLVCGGEAPFLLAWVGRNAPRQQPMVLEDRATPHKGRVLCVASNNGIVARDELDERHYTVASIDATGLLKVWDLNSLQCTQSMNIVVQSPQWIIGLHCFGDDRIVAVTRGEYYVFRIDESRKYAPITQLVGHPKGVTVMGCIGPDIVEWSCANGRKVQHHRNVAGAIVRCLCFSDDASRVFVVTESPTMVSIHSASSGKRVRAFNANLFKLTEPSSVDYCAATRRIILTTTGNTVWFLPTHGSDEDDEAAITSCALLDGDTSCACLAIGRLDSGSLAYFVGSVEGALHVMIARAEGRVEAVARIPMPCGQLQARQQRRSNAMEDELGHLFDRVSRPRLTTIHWSPSNIICTDSAGLLHILLTRGLALVRSVTIFGGPPPAMTPLQLPIHLRDAPHHHLWNERPNDGSCSETSGREMDMQTEEDNEVVRYATCVAPLVVGVFVVYGDNMGAVTVCRIDRKRRIVVVGTWRAYAKRAIVTLAVENDLVLTAASDAPSLACFNMDGQCCGRWWGPGQRVAEVENSPPLWLKEFDERESASTLYIDAEDGAGSPGGTSSTLHKMAKRKQLRKAQQNIDRHIAETELSSEDRDALIAVIGGPTSPAGFGAAPAPHSIAAVAISGTDCVMTEEDEIRMAVRSTKSVAAAAAVPSPLLKVQPLREDSRTTTPSRSANAIPPRRNTLDASTLSSDAVAEHWGVEWKTSAIQRLGERDATANVPRRRILTVMNQTDGLPVIHRPNRQADHSGAPSLSTRHDDTLLVLSSSSPLVPLHTPKEERNHPSRRTKAPRPRFRTSLGAAQNSPQRRSPDAM